MSETNDRLERIGSSMIHNICFEGGYNSYEKLVLKKPTPVNDPMERGLRFELPIMQWAADVNGWTFRKTDTKRWEKDGVPYRDTPDFWGRSKDSDDEFICEVKSHSSWIEDEYGEEYGSQVPERVAIQAQMHCEANHRDHCRVIAFFGSTRPRVYLVDRDPELWGMIEQKCAKFWHDHVIPKVIPAVNGSADCSKFLARIEQANDKLIEAEATDIELDARLQDVEAQLTIWTAEKKKIQNHFRERISENLGVVGPDFKWTLKANKLKKVVDYKAITAELYPQHPDLFDKHTTYAEGSRILRRAKPRGAKS